MTMSTETCTLVARHSEDDAEHPTSTREQEEVELRQRDGGEWLRKWVAKMAYRAASMQVIRTSYPTYVYEHVPERVPEFDACLKIHAAVVRSTLQREAVDVHPKYAAMRPYSSVPTQVDWLRGDHPEHDEHLERLCLDFYFKFERTKSDYIL